MRTFSRPTLLLAFAGLLSGCQIPYLMSSAYNQAKLLANRVPIEHVIADPKTPPEVKRKLSLGVEARLFAQTELGLAETKNYTQYVELGRPYVSYIVHAAPAFKLEHYLWSFPIVGKVPYKGFFSLEKAKAEAACFDAKEYDTFVRGVTAFSTLGWFNDPILSSMLSYDDHDLVNTVIHETVHATVYIKGQADFNEQLATYIGNLGTEIFYKKHEGEKSQTIKIINEENEDDKMFSSFITDEIKSLKEWYETKGAQKNLEEKTARLAQIQKNFKEKLKPKLKAHRFDHFADEPLNNARLLSYGVYFTDLSDFDKLYEKLGRDFKALINFSKNLARSKDPQKDFKSFIAD